MYDGSGVVLPYKPIVAPKLYVLLYDGSGGMFPYNQIVAPMWFKRLYGGIGEKSIGYPRKVYRLFPDRTIQTIRSLSSSAPSSPIARSAPFVQTVD